MARINLLPWRKELRERKNKEFNALIAAVAAVAALCVLVAFTFLNNDLNNQLAANKRIEDANAQLDVALKSIETLEAKREEMLSQMKVIQDLQGRRSIPVRVWHDLAYAITQMKPSDDVYLINIKREGDVITITGKADNANIVANLVRQINNSEWLDASAVTSIKSKIEAYQQAQSKVDLNRELWPEDSYVEFIVTTVVQAPKAEGEEQAQEGQSSAGVVGIDDALATPIGVEPVDAPTTSTITTPEPEVVAPEVVDGAQPQPQPQAQVVPESENAEAGAQ